MSPTWDIKLPLWEILYTMSVFLCWLRCPLRRTRNGSLKIITKSDYYITKLNRLNIICLPKHSLVSSTVVMSVVSTFSIALVFFNLYPMLLFIVKSSLQSATEIIINLIDWLIDWNEPWRATWPMEHLTSFRVSVIAACCAYVLSVERTKMPLAGLVKAITDRC